MQHILNKSFSDITFEDIQELVDKKREENEILEYKEKYNSEKIGRDISALANTYGGYIIIGAKEKKGTSYPERLVNVRQSDLENAVDSICFNEINPPVIAFDRKYLKKKGGRSRIFVVKVDESDLTPHAVEYGTTVYIRKKAQKAKVEFTHKADLNQIDWLKDRRQRYVQRRDMLIERSRQRYSRLTRGGTLDDLFAEFFIVPKYPREQLRDTYDLPAYLRDFEGRLPAVVPKLNLGTMESAHDSLIVSNLNVYNRNHYTEINCFGLYFSRIPLEVKREEGFDNYINFLDFGKQMFDNLFISGEMYKDLSYRGNLFFTYQLDASGVPIYILDRYDDTPLFKGDRRGCVDHRYLYESDVEPTYLLDSRLELFSNIIDGIVQTFGGGTHFKAGEVADKLKQYMSLEQYEN